MNVINDDHIEAQYLVFTRDNQLAQVDMLGITVSKCFIEICCWLIISSSIRVGLTDLKPDQPLRPR